MERRDFSLDAVTLRVRSQGEANRDAFFFTPERGLLCARVYGGPKSRLRAYVSPFHSGLLYLYHDPVRDSYKVCDFDVKNWKAGLREVYERSLAADLVAEVALSTGEGAASALPEAEAAPWETAFSLVNSTLDALAGAAANEVSAILAVFLRKWNTALGNTVNGNTSVQNCIWFIENLSGKHLVSWQTLNNAFEHPETAEYIPRFPHSVLTSVSETA